MKEWLMEDTWEDAEQQRLTDTDESATRTHAVRLSVSSLLSHPRHRRSCVANPVNWSVSSRRRIIEPDAASETTALTLTDSGRRSTVDRGWDGTGRAVAPPCCRRPRPGWDRLLAGRWSGGGRAANQTSHGPTTPRLHDGRTVSASDRPTVWSGRLRPVALFLPSVDVHSASTSRQTAAPTAAQKHMHPAHFMHSWESAYFETKTRFSWKNERVKIVKVFDLLINYREPECNNMKRCSPRDHGLGFETSRNRNFAIMVLKDRSRVFSRPIINLLACMRRKILIFCTS